MGYIEKWNEYKLKNPNADKESYRVGWVDGTNNEKKINYIKERGQIEAEKIPFTEIIEITNEVLGKAYKVTATYKALIQARWKEGFRQEDFRRVCETKKKEWDANPDMRIYLRPETLYGTKMNAYANQEINIKRTVEPEWL